MQESASGGGCLLPGRGKVCAPGGCVCSGGCLLRECPLWLVSALGGVCSGGCLPWGASAPGGGIPACTEADTPCEQNDRQVQKYYLGHNFVAAGNKINKNIHNNKVNLIEDVLQCLFKYKRGVIFAHNYIHTSVCDIYCKESYLN